MKRFATLVATAGGAGYWPWGPGTAGSLVGLGLAWLMARQFDWATGLPLLSVTLVATWPGVVSFERASGLGLQADVSFEAVVRAYIADHPEAVHPDILAAVRRAPSP